MFGRRVIDDEDFQIESKYSLANLIGIVFALIFLPAYIVAVIAEGILFRKLRIKWTILLPIQVIFLVIGFFIVRAIGLDDGLNSILRLYISALFLTAPLIVSYKVIKDVFYLSSYPEFKSVKGWTKNFEYSTTILEKIRKEKLKKECEKGEAYREDKAPLGVLDKPVILDNGIYRRPEVVYKYNDEAEKHSVITGAPGSGKTVDMLNQIYNDMVNKRPILMIDNKGAIDVVYFLSKWAKEMGREFYHFAPGYSEEYNNPYNKQKAKYDPFVTGSTTYVSETMLFLMEYDKSAQIYKQTSRSVLGTVAFLLDSVNQQELPQIPWSAGKIAQTLAAFEPSNMYALINNLKNKLHAKGTIGELEKNNLENAEELYNSITKSRETDLSKQARTYKLILNSLLTSSYGEWLVNTKDSKIINLEKLLNDENGPVILFSLSQQQDKEFARIIGGMILSNLNQVSSNRGNRHKEGLTPCCIYIDEVQTLPITDLSDMLEKARATRMPMMLSLQNLDQIIKAGYDESFVESVISNTSNFIVHQGVSEDAALRYSKIIGQRTINKVSHSAKLRTWLFSPWWYKIGKRDITNAEDKEYIIEPELFQELSAPNRSNGYKSTAYYISKDCSDPLFQKNIRTIARLFRAVVPPEITDGVPVEFQNKYNKNLGKVRRDNQKLVNKITSGAKISLKQKQAMETSKRKSQQTKTTRKAPIQNKANSNINKERIDINNEKRNTSQNKTLSATIINQERYKDESQLSEYEKMALSTSKVKVGKNKKFKPKQQGLPDLSDLDI